MAYSTPLVRGRILLIAAAITAFSLTACKQTKTSHTAPETKWTGTWSTAPQLVEPRNMPPEPGLSNNTLRQIVRPSIGGDTIRMRFTNEFSTETTVIKKAVIARSLGGSNIDTSTIAEFQFNGKTEVSISPGTAVVTDAIPFDLQPRTDVAITIYFGDVSADISGHPGSRTTSFILAGDHLEDESFAEPTTADRWYIINEIDVRTPDTAAAIVVLGNSITDGRGSGTNKQNRWPDVLAEKLLAHPGTRHISVLNMGIGGNCVLRSCLGPSALDRFQRDVLSQDGVKWLIVLEGVNDLGQTANAETADSIASHLISAYQKMIAAAHKNDIQVFGATIMPFGNSFYYADHREPARQKVNAWIRDSGEFDAVIDFDSIIRRPEDHLMMKDGLHDGDFLHPSEEGYRVMGSAISPELFK